MNKYVLLETDSFYNNPGNTHYFNYENKIYAIRSLLDIPLMASYDSENKTFSEYKNLKYVDKLQNVTGHTWFTSLYLIDTINYEYTVRKFPYYICEIDGNMICSCMNENFIYIFHSETERYDTGLFIYSIKDDKFNDEDFFKTKKEFTYMNDNDIELEITSNKFTSLHNLDIVSCYYHNNKLYLLIDNKVYTFEDNKLVEILDNVDRTDYITCWKDNIICSPLKYNDSYVYVNGKKYIQLEDNKLTIQQHVIDNKLILLRRNYYNPYGMIYLDNFKETGYEIISIEI